jgi:hypothetical protein
MPKAYGATGHMQKPDLRSISELPVRQNNSDRELGILVVVFLLAIADRNLGKCGDGQVWRVVCTESHQARLVVATILTGRFQVKMKHSLERLTTIQLCNAGPSVSRRSNGKVGSSPWRDISSVSYRIFLHLTATWLC